MSRLLHIRESLASRISLWVVLCVVVILTATVFVGNYYVVKSIKLEESVKANGILYIMGQRIDAALVSVEVAVKNHINDIKDNLDDPDQLYCITRRMLEDNPSIVGSAIAFRPGYFPEKGIWFSPYSYREGDSIRSKQLGSALYDYRTMDWYRTTDSLRHDYWSEPYFDAGGGEMPMTTYSYPVMDEADSLVMVVTADILLEDLSKLLDVNYYDNAYACMIGRSGTFISHPLKELVLRQTIFSIAEQTGHPELMEVGREVIGGKSGMRAWHSSTFGDAYIFFVPFEHTGWSMAIVCKATELFKGVRRTVLFLSVLFFLMLLLLATLLRRGVHRLIAPLTTFARAADEVARGNLQATLPDIRSKDEMQRLHHSFGLMQQSLVGQMEELKQVNEARGRMEGELKVARDIQLAMLPKAFTPAAGGENLDIFGQQTSAREVGGDLYDFFVRSDKLFFCIGDISGKGVPAAFVMSMVLSQFRSVSHYEDDPGKIIGSINRTTCEGNDASMFVTFFAGVLDLASGRLRYCNAGHNKPFVVNDTTTELPARPDLPLGVSDEANYTVREFILPPDAMLFLYTDGLTEAMNMQREQFGSGRLAEYLKRDADCQTQVERMTQAVRRFTGEAAQRDDLTMLAIRRLASHQTES